MRAFRVLVILVIAWSIAALCPGPVQAQCNWSPSSGCPAVPRGAASYPCYSTQIKGDWQTMLYHTPAQPSYAVAGAGYAADIWCFSGEQEALYYGFRRALR